MECKHEPDMASAEIVISKDEQVVVDIKCRKCGTIGSWDATPLPMDINW
jgi:hypothetical protein